MFKKHGFPYFGCSPEHRADSFIVRTVIDDEQFLLLASTDIIKGLVAVIYEYKLMYEINSFM